MATKYSPSALRQSRRGWPSTIRAFGSKWILSYHTSDKATYEIEHSEIIATVSLSRHRGVYFTQLGAADTKGLKASLRQLERTARGAVASLPQRPGYFKDLETGQKLTVSQFRKSDKWGPP